MSSDLMLKKELPPEKVKKLATNIRRSTDQIERLVSDLLDFGKIEEGKLHVDKAHESPEEVARYALETMSARAHDKNINLNLNTESHLPPFSCDRGRIIQVLWNLLGNAIKFSPENSEIDLEVQRQNGSIKFSVKDHGPGIAPQNLSKVFRKFWQAPEKASLGTGLGLAIAKGIVEAHGGNIWVESTLGEGATFHFTIPLFENMQIESLQSPPV